MRLAVVGADNESGQVAGWLADEGLIVRRFADLATLMADDRDEQFAWLVCAAADGDACLRLIDDQRRNASRCLVIVDKTAVEKTDPRCVVVLRPLRRRVLLETVRNR